MSVEALAIVLHHSRARGTAKLVLIGIANHQGDGGAWPSLGTLATYANVDPRNVRKALETLRGMGELEVRVQAGGLADFDDYTRPNLYQVLVSCPPWCDRTMSHRDTRKRSGRQAPLPLVDKAAPAVDKAASTPGRNRHPRTNSSGGGRTESSPKPELLTQPTQVPASTTERARPTRVGCEPGCVLDEQHPGVCTPLDSESVKAHAARVRKALRGGNTHA